MRRKFQKVDHSTKFVNFEASHANQRPKIISLTLSQHCYLHKLEHGLAVLKQLYLFFISINLECNKK